MQEPNHEIMFPAELCQTDSSSYPAFNTPRQENDASPFVGTITTRNNEDYLIQLGATVVSIQGDVATMTIDSVDDVASMQHLYDVTSMSVKESLLEWFDKELDADTVMSMHQHHNSDRICVDVAAVQHYENLDATDPLDGEQRKAMKVGSSYTMVLHMQHLVFERTVFFLKWRCLVACENKRRQRRVFRT